MELNRIEVEKKLADSQFHGEWTKQSTQFYNSKHKKKILRSVHTKAHKIYIAYVACGKCSNEIYSNARRITREKERERNAEYTKKNSSHT